MDGKSEKWNDWVWQQQNAIGDVKGLETAFPSVSRAFWDKMAVPSEDRLKFKITPYMLSQIPENIIESDLKVNPWFLQFFPQGDLYLKGHGSYDGTDNWEKGSEFPTNNLHHKYTNRVLIRFRNCLAYCNYCFESLGVLEKNSSDEKKFAWGDWQKSLDYIINNSDIEEVIFSGGEPLLNSDSKLEQIFSDVDSLRDLNGAKKVRFKRVHTRVLTHNPYRLTDNLVKIIGKYHINEVALHVSHPSEITSEFVEGVGRLRDIGRNTPLIATHTPLLAGINNNPDTLWELFAKLYDNNIKPYYLLHTMPHVPFGDKQRVSIREGVEIMRKLKRHKSNIALPEYVIAHDDGKQTVPSEINGTPEFQYTKNADGTPMVKFLNWRGKWVEYPDSL